MFVLSYELITDYDSEFQMIKCSNNRQKLEALIPDLEDKHREFIKELNSWKNDMTKHQLKQAGKMADWLEENKHIIHTTISPDIYIEQVRRTTSPMDYLSDDQAKTPRPKIEYFNDLGPIDKGYPGNCLFIREVEEI